MADKLLIVDGSSLFFRAFYALPLLKTKKGIYTNAVYGFVSMLENFIEEQNPEYIVVCFDQKGKTFRHEEYKEYKGTRDKTPTELEQQWPMVREILDYMNIVTLDSPTYEADDIAGTLAEMGKEKGLHVSLLTGDRDYLQLVDKNTIVYLTKKGITNTEKYDEKRIREEYELTPNQLIDLKGLMGDSSDNIPGVPGVGEKTGLKLLSQFGSMEEIYNHLDEVSGKKLKENLENYKTQAFMSKRLGTIVKHVPLKDSLEDLKKVPYDYEKLAEMYREYEFNTLLKRLPKEYAQSNEPTLDVNLETKDISMKNLVEILKDVEEFSFHFLTDGKIYNDVFPYALGIGIKGKPTYVCYEPLEDGLEEIFKNDSKKYGHNVKEDWIILMAQGIEPKNIVFDTKLAQYMINPGQSNYEIQELTKEHLGYTFETLEEIKGKGRKEKELSQCDQDKLREYLAFMTKQILNLLPIQKKLLQEGEMESLYEDIELPLVEVLASMELEGILVDENILDDIGKEMDEEIDSITEAVYQEAEEEFNLNSPKQLGEILFEKLNYPVIKKTKTGYSTSVEVLEKLKGKGPIIDHMLRYRQLAKIKSTYVEGLKKLINPKTGRIHSNFNQTVTATGRISSTDPNLQNIPIRTEEGRLIRKAFVAKDGNIFIDADYSQIELRVLAHISEDKEMLQAFEEGEDIHRTTAAQVFHVDQEDVTSEMRRRAKAVNFGIVYGISDYGLSRDLDIPRKEAKLYIDNYLKHFQGVHNFMEEIVDKGKKQGYVETIFHRRRYIPELSAKNFNVRSFGERIALNTPIQGSAADIIKIAMVHVYQGLKKMKSKGKLVLQIHDELIIEAPKEEVEELSKKLRDWMESATTLKVPINVDLETGVSWYETK